MPKPKKTIILGVDPGYARAGWGIIAKSCGNLTPLAYGCIETNCKTTHAGRLEILNQDLERIIKKYQPTVMAVEELFFFKNLKTAIKVAEARGVILLTAIKNKMAIEEYTPLEIKQATVGYGRADKRQVQKMVMAILNLKNIPELDDTADALAAAITCANTNKLLK